MTEQEKDKRNINPTPEAVLAMILWGEEYAAQTGGSMDFWDKLHDHHKRQCISGVNRILNADKAHRGHPQ